MALEVDKVFDGWNGAGWYHAGFSVWLYGILMTLGRQITQRNRDPLQSKVNLNTRARGIPNHPTPCLIPLPKTIALHPNITVSIRCPRLASVTSHYPSQQLGHQNQPCCLVAPCLQSCQPIPSQRASHGMQRRDRRACLRGHRESWE